MPHSTFNKDLPQSVTPQLHRLLQQHFRQQQQQPEPQPVPTQTTASQETSVIPGAVLKGNAATGIIEIASTVSVEPAYLTIITLGATIITLGATILRLRSYILCIASQGDFIISGVNS